MFKEDTDAFLSDFGEPVFYSDAGSSKQFTAIVDHNVELVGFEGAVSALTSTLTFHSDDDIIIGGTITTNNKSYIIDSVITDDETIKTVSMVKQ